MVAKRDEVLQYRHDCRNAIYYIDEKIKDVEKKSGL